MTENNQEAANIKVICRFRPLSNQEQSTDTIVNFIDEKTVMIGQNDQKFTLDHIFNMDCQQQDIFEVGGLSVINSVLQGFNGTIFAYGQTSSGKTHTMYGNVDDQRQKGLIPRIIDVLMDKINSLEQGLEFSIKVSMIEIYNEKIKDLLRVKNGENLKIREDKIKGIYIDGVFESYISNEKDIYELLSNGNSNRQVSYTQMNSQSSRSHLLFFMTISQKDPVKHLQKTSKLYLVDLAGSEKISKTGAEGVVLEEAKKINQSLSCLGNVINALTDGNQFIPYRNSLITRILQESLGGNSKTTLIVTCSPSQFNEQETISTLRFGIRAKSYIQYQSYKIKQQKTKLKLIKY